MALTPSGSLPFRMIDTKAEITHIFQSKKPVFQFLNCPRKSRNFSVSRTSGEPRRIQPPRATAKGGSIKGEDGDRSSEHTMEDTIEKSKKALDMQRKLLQQIAEHRKLVSSIKDSIIDQVEDSSEKNKEEDIDPFSGSNGSFLNIDASSTSAESTIGDQHSSISSSKSMKSNNGDLKEIPLEVGRSQDESQNEISESLTPKGALSTDVNRGINAGEMQTGERLASKQAQSSSDSLKELKDAIPKAKQSDILKDSVSSALQSKNEATKELSSLEVTTDPPRVLEKVIPKTKQSDILKGLAPSALRSTNEDLKELSLLGNTNEAESPVGEDVKPPPLAGANVMNVIIVAAECAPWSKTGGLGDVAGSLPKALARRGHRVMVVAPRYGNYVEAQDIGVRRRYKVDGQDVEVLYFHAYIDGVDFVFIDGPMFRHIENNIYGGNRVDILKRMVLFCKAAVEVPWYVPCGGVCYGDGNLVFIANDWHTALLPVYLKAYYRDNGLMKYTRSVLVIHNIAHQGRGPVEDFFICDLPEHYIDLFKLYDPIGGDHFNIFAAGLKAADRVVTVSHGYAWELKTSEGGWGLHGIINESDWKLRGIVNGIDTAEWNPQSDVHLKSDGYINYSVETLDTGKPQCKAALQVELGLPVRDNVPLIGFIGRLDHQKGVDLIAEAIPWMMGQDVQLVMLGTGRHDLEQMLRQFESQYHDKARGWVGFSVRTAHRITAGADILLMPSRFEPCGLNQLYAMNYGTVPVVHAVGGLRDTVLPFDPFNESGFGWTFDSAEPNKLINALGNCFLTYREYKESWKGLQRRGMMQDLSWDRAAQSYEEVLVAAKYQW